MSERDKRLTNEELEKFILCLDCLADKIIEHATHVGCKVDKCEEGIELASKLNLLCAVRGNLISIVIKHYNWTELDSKLNTGLIDFKIKLEENKIVIMYDEEKGLGINYYVHNIPNSKRCVN